MPAELTEQQAAFAREFARSGKGAESARAAGFSHHSAGKYAYQLLAKPQVQAAIQREQRLAFRDLAAVALGQVRTLLEDPKTPPGVRVELCKVVFDRAGLAAIKPEEEAGRRDERSLRELSLQELEAIAVSLKFKRAPAVERREPVTIGEASLADQEQGPPVVDSE